MHVTKKPNLVINPVVTLSEPEGFRSAQTCEREKEIFFVPFDESTSLPVRGRLFQAAGLPRPAA